MTEVYRHIGKVTPRKDGVDVVTGGPVLSTTLSFPTCSTDAC